MSGITNDHMTLHARTRARQRGLTAKDLALAMAVGTHTVDGVFVRRADADASIRELKKQIAMIERLKGLYIAMPQDRVVTLFRPDRSREQAILRHANRNRPTSIVER